MGGEEAACRRYPVRREFAVAVHELDEFRWIGALTQAVQAGVPGARGGEWPVGLEQDDLGSCGLCRSDAAVR
jgi:hypothetical protein